MSGQSRKELAEAVQQMGDAILALGQNEEELAKEVQRMAADILAFARTAGPEQQHVLQEMALTLRAGVRATSEDANQRPLNAGSSQGTPCTASRADSSQGTAGTAARADSSQGTPGTAVKAESAGHTWHCRQG
jgi:hypothetical protein